MDKVDNNIPMYLRWLIYNLATVMSTMIAICYSTPIFIVVAIPLIILYIIIQVS